MSKKGLHSVNSSVDSVEAQGGVGELGLGSEVSRLLGGTVISGELLVRGAVMQGCSWVERGVACR